MSKAIYILFILFFLSCDENNSQKKTNILPNNSNKLTPDHREKSNQAIRFCIFDHYMPLSESSPDSISKSQGLYHDIGVFIATSLGKTADFSVITDYFFQRPLRKGLLSGICDVQLGLPSADGKKYIRKNKVFASLPYLNVGYVIVTPKRASRLTIQALEDMNISVLSGSPPQTFLLKIGSQLTPVYEVDDAIKLLSEKKVDACFVWGPRAAYLNKYIYNNTFSIYETPYKWDVVMGIKVEDEATYKKIDSLYPKLLKFINTQKEQYGMYGFIKFDFPKKLLY